VTTFLQNQKIKKTNVFRWSCSWAWLNAPARTDPASLEPWTPEVAGVTFSNSDSAPVPKFLNPCPGSAIFQIWESDSCSDSGYNHRSNRNSPMFLLKKWPHRLLLLSKLKCDSGSGFSQIFDSGSGPKEKRRIQTESTPVIRIRSHVCWTLGGTKAVLPVPLGSVSLTSDCCPFEHQMTPDFYVTVSHKLNASISNT